MKKVHMKTNRILSLSLVVLILSLLLSPLALAEGRIETDRDAALHIVYKNGDIVLPNAEFTVCKVANVDERANMTVTPAFSSCAIDFEDIDQEGWQEMAITLKAYAQAEDIEAYAVKSTDENGIADFTVKPGLYLVYASPVTLDDMTTHFSDPFLVHLPIRDSENNVWVYATEAHPKNTDYTTVRKVLKIWDDEGYENLRPLEILVDLLCDGEIVDTVSLTAENEWRYDWGDLDPDHDWLVAERVPEGYYAVTEQQGKVFTVTNKFIEPSSSNEIYVKKKITGNTSQEKETTFTFILSAVTEGAPMPMGVQDSEVRVSIEGAGYVSFGKIEFARPGVYVYEVCEEQGNEKGWTYDDKVYTVTFTVTETEGVLSTKREITELGDKVTDIEFINDHDEPEIPQTGLLWWPVFAMLLSGFLLLILGIGRARS